MAELADFLATVNVFAALDASERAEVASRCRVRALGAGSRLLAQGAANDALYILRTGRLVVRSRQLDRVDVVAQLGPPSIVGEVSFLTGSTCSADVDVAVDAEIVELPRAALVSLTRAYERLVHGLAGVVAARLHATLTTAQPPAAVPIVVVQPGRAWAALSALPHSLARSLASETSDRVLLVRVGGSAVTHPGPLEPGIAVASVPAGAADGRARRETATHLPGWTADFAAVVLTSADTDADVGSLASLAPLATHQCVLLGPDDRPPASAPTTATVLQDDRCPTLERLDGTHRLVPDVADAEAAHSAGRAASARFTAVVESIARAVLGQQTGVALGAGGGRGWCHIGVLAALAAAGPHRSRRGYVDGVGHRRTVGAWPPGPGARSRSRGVAPATAARVARLAAAHGERTSPRRPAAALLRRSRRQCHAAAVLGECDRHRNGRGGRAPSRPAAAGGQGVDGVSRMDAARGARRTPARRRRAPQSGPARAVREMGAAFVITVLPFGPTARAPLPARFPARAYELFARTFHLSSVAMGRAASDADSDAVILPDLGDATMLSFDRHRELIAAGRRAGDVQMPAIAEAYERLKQSRRPRSNIVGRMSEPHSLTS